MATKGTKTPVSLLQEFCVRKHHSAPIYTLIEDGTHTNAHDKVFAYDVIAFDYRAEGRGRNKNNAKHEAAANLIRLLQNDASYREELSPHQSETPRSACPEIDAVSVLLDVCVQQDFPVAQFRVQQASGAPHAPEFVVECQVANIIREGVFSSKKGAKQLAAKKVLDVLQDVAISGELLQIAKRRNDEPDDKKFKRYYEMKKEEPNIKSGVKLSDRYMYFVNLSKEVKEEMLSILYDLAETDKEKVHLICQALKCKYNEELVEKHKTRNTYCVEIFCEYDLCFANTMPEVYQEILEYFRVALNFRQR